MERADLVHFVAEEIDAEGVLSRGREHVDDAASHRELAAALHHVDARVGGVDEGLLHVGEFVVLPDGERDGLHLRQPFDLGLQHGAHGRDDHLRRAIGGDATKRGEAFADGVRARREALVWERFPGREVHHFVAAQPGGELVDELLGLAVRGGDGQHRRALFRDGGGEDGEICGHGGEIECRDASAADIVEGIAKRRIRREGLQ